MHAVFEVLLSEYLKDFSSQKAIELGDILFNSNINSQRAIEVGFKQKTIDELSQLDKLTFDEMKKNFLEIINQLEAHGYFVVEPTDAICEKKFK